MSELTVKYNDLTAEQFIELWETVWGNGPSLQQTELAMKHTLFRVSIWDDDRIIAMARMNGDMGLNYYIKDVVVRPEYQKKGIGRMLINELFKFNNSFFLFNYIDYKDGLMYNLFIQSSKKALSAFFRENDLGRTLLWRFSYASAVIF